MVVGLNTFMSKVEGLMKKSLVVHFMGKLVRGDSLCRWLMEVLKLFI
jgi:hypothetical protein